MVGKGNGRMTKHCEELAGSGYPHEVSRLGLINLLAGTDDRENPKHWEWTGMVWSWLAKDKPWPDDYKRWPNEYRQNEANKLRNEQRYVELLLHPLTPAAAAQWLKDIGETPDTLSDEVKHWLCDYLGNPGKPRPHRQHRLDLLIQIINRLKAFDPDLDIRAMPGVRADLLRLCRKLYPKEFHIAQGTFNNDLSDSDICSFRSGAKPSDYYKEKEPQLSRLS